MFLRVLNVNLDHHDFRDFRYTTVCHQTPDYVSLPAIIDSAVSEDRPTQLLTV